MGALAPHNRITKLFEVLPKGTVLTERQINDITGGKDIRLTHRALVKLRTEGIVVPVLSSEDAPYYDWCRA